ncbi:MAG: nicotinamide riboside transporter PnuC [Flavobacteriales bacterium TMED96]|nr:MAG: nicotinamide riboside transporter PnuC [Flavobacteriales bacterium TMED96]|tara:strand:- start:608 stop:1225 length:618 start_codon:yes stop_codon:yes gene_type:complete
MSQFLEGISIDLGLEVFAAFLGVLSVWFAKKNKILVYPTGIISTLIYVWILFKNQLLGDLIVNAYFFLMSIYGWFFWSRKNEGNFQNNISRLNLNESIFGLIIFTFGFITINYLYNISNWQENHVSSIDTLTTAIFCSAMWFMARRKIEHWILWIIGDIISVPLYIYKGLYFTSIQYLIFTIIALLGFFTWLRELNKKKLTVKEL